LFHKLRLSSMTTISIKRLVSIFFLSFGITACTQIQNTEERPEPLYPQPQSRSLNTTNGYATNLLTGDSINDLVNAHGDTIHSGTPIPAKGKVIPSSEVAQPKSVAIPPQDKLTQKLTPSNVHPLSNSLQAFTISEDSIKITPIIKIPEDDTLHYLINSYGDTVKTGVSIKANGKAMTSPRLKSKLAGVPRYKDDFTHNLQYLDVDQGLASSFLLATLVDHNGNVWFGSNGGGVSKYDGVSFTLYGVEEGLSSNSVLTIFEDSNGNIWFGTWGGGVTMYDGNVFTHFNEKEGLSKNVVWAIEEDNDGNLWFGTNGGGVNKYDGETFTYYTKKEGFFSNYVVEIEKDHNGNLWFGSFFKGICKYDGKSFAHFTHSEALGNNGVRSIKEDSEGNLWIGTSGDGVRKFDGKTFTKITTEEGLNGNYIFSIIQDQDKNMWFGTTDGGVSKFDGQKFTHYTEEVGLSYNMVWSLAEDNSGNIWIATNGGGANKYQRGSFANFTENEGLSNKNVWSILEDQNRNLWFGTTGGGLNKYDGQSFTHIRQEDGLCGESIWSILEDSDGNLWFGSFGEGVTKFDGKSFTNFNLKEGLSDNRILAMEEDNDGNLWFGTYGAGVNKYDGETFTYYTEKEGLSDNVVQAIMKDRKGNLWMGSEGGGLTKYDGTSFTHFTTKEGLSHNNVNDIVEDNDGSLWIATSGGGVNLFDGEKFTYFTEKQGLNEDAITLITKDRNGEIWAGSTNGLTHFKPEESASNKKTYSLDVYVTSDGLKGANFYRHSRTLDSKNRLWLGSGKGLVMLDMNNHKPATEAPNVSLRQLNINEQFIDFRNISDSLGSLIKFSEVARYENYPLNLELPHNFDHLTFQFSAIDWSAPQKIKYTHIIEGLNTSWSEPSHAANADYRNLPYGTYTFKVRAAGQSGDWSEPFEYTFTINAPWWHTWYARFGYLVLFILFVVGTVRWRTASLQQRQKELQTKVDMATVEISEQKEQVEREKGRSEKLLLNILPEEVAEELMEKGHSDAQLIDEVTVLFTDFKGFTSLSEKVTPKELVADLHECFSAFDSICEKHSIEKIKTIGDAYMAAGGLPSPNNTHAQDTVNAAMEMAKVIEKGKAKKIAQGLPYFEIRIGIHTGPVVAGIVGVKKFQYDIWGDTVNTASRMESHGEVGKVNISNDTYELIKDNPQFTFESRGIMNVKGKGKIEMYFVS
jgi:ligand-binding sensor domain-containing protein/class 3 adenylate cyclase